MHIAPHLNPSRITFSIVIVGTVWYYSEDDVADNNGDGDGDDDDDVDDGVSQNYPHRLVGTNLA